MIKLTRVVVVPPQIVIDFQLFLVGKPQCQSRNAKLAVAMEQTVTVVVVYLFRVRGNHNNKLNLTTQECVVL